MLVGLIFSCITSACRKMDIYQNVKQHIGKNLTFPDSLIVKTQGKNVANPLHKPSDYRIINYLDTTQCVPCESQFHEWQLFKHTLDSLNLNAEIIFIIWSKEYKELEMSQTVNKCNIPCIYDTQNHIGILNRFSPNPEFHTFLLDSLNKILLVGNPVRNKTVQKLYIRRMTP